ncbi:MAG: N-formylglutamate amidohydrolase [Candidatus Aminicenantales bacterium]
MAFANLLVVIPHSGIVIPAEIPLDSLSDYFHTLVKNVDWYTNWLYDFRDQLQNTQVIFPYCSLILEGNRHPDIFDDSVPLRDVHGEPIYRPGKEPDRKLREFLSRKYLRAFHRTIAEEIARGKTLMFEGHSTVSARGVSDNQVDLMNMQITQIDGKPRYFCPDLYVETYANELQKRLPEVQVTINQSEYIKTYGHVCAEHSINAIQRKGNKVPAILQETNERLYKNPDRTPNVEALNGLRRIFAESLAEMLKKTKRQ